MSSRTPPPPTTTTTKKKRRTLVGYQHFTRTNPRSDLFPIARFHSIEFFCRDAKTTANRFAVALGMNACGKNDETTGNKTFNSYAMKSHELVFAFTAPARTEAAWSLALRAGGDVTRSASGSSSVLRPPPEPEEEAATRNQSPFRAWANSGIIEDLEAVPHGQYNIKYKVQQLKQVTRRAQRQSVELEEQDEHE